MDAELEPCKVCGGTDTKLSDGFYYCIECGTQNTNVRETILEEKALGDGTFAIASRRKIVQLDKEDVEMSGEWYKWHAYNFIISGLANELISLGAKPSFKEKLLWIWTRYIKKYQDKSKLLMNKTQDDNDQTALPSFMMEEDTITDEQNEQNEEETGRKRPKWEITNSRRDVKFLSRAVITAMLYLALNLDESDIQLSHLYRFIQEKQLDIMNLNRFVPSDIKLKQIPEWLSFIRSRLCNPHQLRALAMSLLRKLDLGTPKLPDLRKMIDNYLTELCLPNDMKQFIYSLMHFRKCDFLDIHNKTELSVIRLPDYEGTVMAYVLVAIKICFGLDCDYEIKLSTVVDKINEERDLPKSFRIGNYSDLSDRLFSFREWCNYLQFRKAMLCKYNLRMAEKYGVDIDDCIYFEQMEERPKNNEILSDKIAMEVLSRIPYEQSEGIISKEYFSPSLTPMSEYTDVIIDHCQDQEIKLQLAEDFKRYSLKYAFETLELLDSNMINIIKGVNQNKKYLENDIILGTIVTKRADTKMVYIKNCENRNWMKTNKPTIEHVSRVDQVDDTNNGNDTENEARDKENDDSDKENDAIDKGNYASNKENSVCDKKTDASDKENDAIEKGIYASDKENGVSDKENGVSDKENGVSDKANEAIDNVNDASDKDSTASDKENEPIDKENEKKKYASDKENDVNDFSDHGYDSENTSKDKDLDSIADKSQINQSLIDETAKDYSSKKEENRHEIIIEEDSNVNIFDDCFEDINLKEECEKMNNDDYNINDFDDGEVRNNELPDEDFDRRSNISDDPFLPVFNPDTFDKERTIKELILAACKKYKIPIPAEYKTVEPRKRREKRLGEDGLPVKRWRRNQHEGKATVKELVGSYYNFVESDFVTKVQQEMSLAIRTAELENQDHDSSSTNVQVTVNSFNDDVNQSEINSTIGPVDELDTHITNQTDANDNTKEIYEDLEKTLFEEDKEVKLDDLIPKGDPKFDENKYDIDQLYLEVKVEVKETEEQIFLKTAEDPEIDKILLEKIEQREEPKLTKTIGNKAKLVNDNDSEDEIPLSVLREESILMGEMCHREENFEHLIKKENIAEYNYWIRHYDKNFMLKSTDWHANFDEELKVNTPSSFYFVLQECTSIINCSKFCLYKHMQLLEEYLVSKAEKVDFDLRDTVMINPDESPE